MGGEELKVDMRETVLGGEMRKLELCYVCACGNHHVNWPQSLLGGNNS